VPAVIPVMSLADSGPGTLRAAITQSDQDTTPDTITFEPGVTGTIPLVSALPDLSHTLTIDGPGRSMLTVARSAAPGTPDFRIFTVPTGADVTISGLTVSGGSVFGGDGGGISNAGALTVSDSTLSGNSAESGFFGGGDGGGIDNTGTLTVSDSTLSGNSVAGGPTTGGGSGGGISNAGALTVSDSTLSGNSALNGSGGGIDNFGTLTVSDSTLSGNSAGGSGGGIDNFGTLTVTDSTLSGNSAVVGGGISNAGTLTVTDSTLSGNRAFLGFGAGAGGGISNAGTLTVTGSTLSGNGAGLDGGGISNNAGTLTVTASIFDNPDGGNLSPGRSTFVSKGHNLFSDSPGVTLNPTDLINTNPLLGPLAPNGGPTQTMALLPGSPAIDAGITVPGVSTDQRGVPRPQGTAPDIGAFESRGFTLAVVSGAGQTAPANSPFPAPLVVSVTSAYHEPVAGGRVTFTAPSSGPSARLAGSPATIGADGRASVTASANGLVGTYAVTARAAGAGGVALSLTNVGPAVVLLQRFGLHAQPTLLVLTFNRPMDAATAQDLRNYVLFQVGPLGFAGPHPQPIPITAAVYDPVTQSVILAPRSPLALGGYYLLTVSGAGPHPVRDVTGAALTGTGTGGQPGDYIALVHGPGPWVTPPPVVPARTAPAVPTGPRPSAQLRWRR
jgi:hypothetical protein